MIRRIATLLLLGLGFLVLSPAPASAKIKVGKALRKTAAAVSAPVRHPMTATKATFAFTYTGFLAGVEGVGVVLEGVGTGVKQVGTYIYDVGEVLAGGSGK